MDITGKGKSKSMGIKSGVAIRGGSGGMLHNTQRTGPQAPGHSGPAKGGGDSKFAANPGRGGMLGKQSVQAARPGRVGKSGGGGGGGGEAPRKGKRGYADDANGNSY